MQDQKEHPHNRRQIASTLIKDDDVNEINNDATHNFQIMLPDFSIPRPSYYPLQLLGMWKPSNTTLVWNLHHRVLIPVLWIFTVLAIFARGFIGYSNFRWGRLINSCFSVLNLGAPYLLCQYYFHFGSYCEFVSNAMMIDRETAVKIQRLSKYFSFISFLFWIISFLFFFSYYEDILFLNTFYLVSYTIVLLFCTGCWSAWLSVYGFVCGVLKLQIVNFLQIMKEKYGYSTRTKQAEENSVRELLTTFTVIQDNINQIQKDFEKIITFSIIVCIIDTVILSIAYWKQDFNTYPLYRYIMVIIFEFVSIMFKLCPAAVVNQTVHEIVRVAGESCYPDINVGETPKQRFVFYQFLFTREGDLGMHILGLKITSKLTVGLFVTIGTVGLTFLYYAVPFLKKIGSF